jgi:hypothetical protein
MRRIIHLMNDAPKRRGLSDDDGIMLLKEASQVTTLHPDTLARNYPDLIVHLSKRRRGITRGNVRAIIAGEAKPAA